MPAPNNDQLLQDAMRHIEGRAYLATGSVVADAEAIVRNAVSRGISAGRSIEDISRDAYVQLARNGFLTSGDLMEATGLGAAEVTELLGDSEAMQAARLDTIVRTNVFDAFNEARFDYFTDESLGGFVQAFEYSAILDENTTEICEELDGSTWKADNPVWDTHTPPNHYNCRSVLIPVVVGDDFEESDPPTVEPQKGFG